MLILLPPSEGKTAAHTEKPVDLAELIFPELTEARERVAQELVKVSAGVDALSVLKVGKTLSAEVERNQQIFAEPVAPASEIYSGVLFDALDYASLTVAGKENADRVILIISALWGAVGLTDEIPAYRLSMGVKLGHCGNLATFWKGELSPVLVPWATHQLVIDCRSAAYANAWKPAPEHTFAVRVEQVQTDGGRKVVSHFAKHYRGLLVRFIVENGLSHLNNIQDLVAALNRQWEVELTLPRARKPGCLTLVVPAP